MRIRKRQVPFPLLPVPHSSDPNLMNRSPVMVQLNDATTKPNNSCTHHHGSTTAPSPLLDRPQPSDQPLPSIGKPTNGSDEPSSGEGGAHTHLRKQDEQESLVEDGRRKEEGEGQKGNDSRKGNISGSESPAETFSSPTPPKQDGRWYEGEKAFPLKKRRGAFAKATGDNNNNNDDDDDDINYKKNPKMRRMKTKMNKKCSRQDDSIMEEEEVVEKEEEAAREAKPEVQVGKKRVRGGALMEGSRCSRVNGRGWRCCQQTLVGYSLCEHHLGKGRLRSMTSVRNKSNIGTSVAPKHNNNNNNMPQSEPSSEKQTTKSRSEEDPLGNDAEKIDEKKPLVTKRRMKLGMVKARSISSLLGQTNTHQSIVAAVAESNNNNDSK